MKLYLLIQFCKWVRQATHLHCVQVSQGIPRIYTAVICNMGMATLLPLERPAGFNRVEPQNIGVENVNLTLYMA